ncbi:PTS cellobiose transporter subunit IIC [Oceanobacillus profundus]|uniref:PTS cellobiose transporter subunit IIC n=1 Tax=Oceanobacillus TaxID=182709 RepID=UPI000BA59E80|nr:PTS cellobiose transporter subunit IIC [Oceanobacillus profundus]MBR3119870.1 PTS cellobiose transporter subunit IIC [Oceanobacillus sp.]MCM3397672.1 PTS cellobiose transporter subunit IIC [Oceanobacillus profundus]MDO6448442.1 PTS cellobiose transporter subunit IIC [Oceanobacillus profundus]PAE27740.1 PTS system, cellobiose-specific IIC component [Paenibacillus sp. 7884-2]
MNGFNAFMEKYFMPVAGKLAEQRHLKAIRDGIISTMPLLIIGSLFLIISSPPVPAWSEFMSPYAPALNIPVNATFGLLGLVAVFSIAYSLAKSYGMDELSSGVLSLAAFFVATPLTEDGNIPLSLMGSQGLFIAILIALFTVEVYRFFEVRNIIIRMPEGVPPSVWRAFSALIPGAAIISIVWGLDLLLKSTFDLSLHGVVGAVLREPLEMVGSSIWGAIIAILLIHLLWAFGIHGISVVASIMAPIWYSLTEQNVAAQQAGEELPYIIGQPFMAIWWAVGGCGMVLSLTILFVWRARSKHLKSLGKGSIWSSVFNISEPVVFGAPIVMNPILVIPFILAPLVVGLLTYFAMSIGLVGKPYIIVPWTTPPPISGILTTGDWRGGVLMLVNIIVALFIYYPFFRLYDKQLLQEESTLDVAAATKEEAGNKK